MKLSSEEPIPAVEKSTSTFSGFQLARQPRTWFLYASDWAVVVAVTAISQIILIPEPATVSFIVTDPYIQQVHYHDKFDITRASVVLSTAIPAIVVIIWLGWFRHPFSDIHLAVLGLGMAMSFCALFTAIFKQTTVILAADFLDRCQLDPADYDRSFTTGARLSYRRCKGVDTIRGVRYFPAFTASSGMTFPALETEHHGGGNGWGNACSILLGLLFALMGHLIYCYDMPGALVAYVYGF
ncbi:hypothetical protein LPJ63_000431 [Coemansia sp. RSA 2711]|nr:hypothetical protein LPJ63_000431 [Coemansia sp. RSA 2711]